MPGHADATAFCKPLPRCYIQEDATLQAFTMVWGNILLLQTIWYAFAPECPDNNRVIKLNRDSTSASQREQLHRTPRGRLCLTIWAMSSMKKRPTLRARLLFQARFSCQVRIVTKDSHTKLLSSWQAKKHPTTTLMREMVSWCRILLVESCTGRAKVVPLLATVILHWQI